MTQSMRNIVPLCNKSVRRDSSLRRTKVSRVCDPVVDAESHLLNYQLPNATARTSKPRIETLEKLAHTLECPLYRLFYEGEESPKLRNLRKRKSSDDIA